MIVTMPRKSRFAMVSRNLPRPPVFQGPVGCSAAPSVDMPLAITSAWQLCKQAIVGLELSETGARIQSAGKQDQTEAVPVSGAAISPAGDVTFLEQQLPY